MTTVPPEPTTEPVGRIQPSLRDMVMLDIPVEIKAAPGGNRVALRVRTTHWKNNQYERLCYIHDPATNDTSPLTRSGNVHQMEWLDEHTLALLWTGPDPDDKPQIWIFERLLGQGWQVTYHKSGVDWFFPFSGGMLFQATNPKREERRKRSASFGKFTHWEHEESASALYFAGLEELRQYEAHQKSASDDDTKSLALPVIELSRLLPGPLSIRKVIPSPKGDVIYLNCWPYDDLVYRHETRSYAIHTNAPQGLTEYLRRKTASLSNEPTEEQEETKDQSGEKEKDLSYLGEIVQLQLPRDATVDAVSPDGRNLLLRYQERDTKMYTRTDLWTIDTEALLHARSPEEVLEALHNISAPLDQEVMDVQWTTVGIMGSYVESTRIRLACSQVNGHLEPLDLGDIFLAWDSFDVAASGHLGLVGANTQLYPDGYLIELTPDATVHTIRRISDFGRAVAKWDLGTVETMRWPSKDGVEIEGVLRKPSNFDPDKKYPLVFIVHGGPSWFSPEYLFCDDNWGYYPAAQFLHKDMVVVEPNYRGSVGRGQAFMELNVDNLGVGDLWDLESAIDHLDQLGWIDTERVGCMGWSQGGYISAFAALHSKRFKAVSVGAGVSDWYTYHISNDIPSFTLDYLSASPFRNREPYTKTAPMSNLAQASTPMLIQHGSNDQRVPLSNALELYRGLQEMGVPVELFVFPGMGHPITRPRENHAILHQNLAWFSHHLLGEDLRLE